MSNKFGIIISIENYKSGLMGLPPVKYANADAQLVKELFVNQLGISEENIREYHNHDFTCTTPQEIRYYLTHLHPEVSEVYVYYAGHGFFSDGINYLTAYDTSRLNLKTTSITFEDLFLHSFKESTAKRCIAFIDACAEGINDKDRSIGVRGLNFSSYQDSFSREGFSYALFFACAPEEKSFSSDELQHGVWTWHLSQAFCGKDLRAFTKKHAISVYSLRDYLHAVVSDYNKSSSERLGKQTPYTLISSDDDQVIWEPMDKVKSFEEQIDQLEEEFFDRCYCVNFEFGLHESEYVYYNYSIASDLCWELVINGYKLPEKWTDSLVKLQYYAARAKEEKNIELKYDEQMAELEELTSFINAIPFEF